MDTDLKEHTGEYIILTPNTKDWYPHSEGFKDQ